MIYILGEDAVRNAAVIFVVGTMGFSSVIHHRNHFIVNYPPLEAPLLSFNY